MGCCMSKNEVREGEAGHAKEKKQKKEKDEEAEEITMEMKQTNIPSLDSVFDRASSPLKRLCEIRNAFHTARHSIKQLSKLKDPEHFVEEVLKDIKQTLKDVQEGGIELYAEIDGENVYIKTRPDVVPEHLAKMVKAATDLADAIRTTFSEAKELKPDLEALAEEAKALPDRVTGAAQEAGLSPLKIPGAAKATASNCKELARAPQLLAELVDESQKLVKQIAKAFEP
eukprot:m51a1_g12681 hypothetical protein (228) ;mRNA; f:2055-2853